MMPMSGQLPDAHRPAPCKTCRGTRGQHAGGEGCLCPRCDAGPDGARCRSYAPDFDARPEQRRSGRRIGLTSATDSKVQRDGAVKALPRIGTRRREAYDVIRSAERRGMTFDELCGVLGRNYSQTGPRVRELVADGWVVRSGSTRPGTSGADQEVWLAACYAPGQNS